MIVHTERMRANLDASFGLVFSEAVLLALVEAGLERDDAYRLVQHAATRTWEEQRPFRDVLADDPEITAHLSPERLDECFDLNRAVAHAQRAPSTRSTKRPHREPDRAAPPLHGEGPRSLRGRSRSDARRRFRPDLGVRRRARRHDPRQGQGAHRPLRLLVRRHEVDRGEPPRVRRPHRLSRDRRCRRRGPGDARPCRPPGASGVRRPWVPVRLRVERLRGDRIGAGPCDPGRSRASRTPPRADLHAHHQGGRGPRPAALRPGGGGARGRRPLRTAP